MSSITPKMMIMIITKILRSPSPFQGYLAKQAAREQLPRILMNLAAVALLVYHHHRHRHHRHHYHQCHFDSSCYHHCHHHHHQLAVTMCWLSTRSSRAPNPFLRIFFTRGSKLRPATNAEQYQTDSISKNSSNLGKSIQSTDQYIKLI